MKQWMIKHNMQPEWIDVCLNNRRNLVDAAKHYLKKAGYQILALEDNPQLQVFLMSSDSLLDNRGLVRVTSGPSCTKGVGRENITTSKFFPSFDFYIKPEVHQSHFIFTRHEK